MNPLFIWSKFRKGSAFLLAAGKVGQRDANYYLGTMHLKGQGVSRNNLQAVELFEKKTTVKDP